MVVGTSGMLELLMEIVDIDEMIILDGKPVMGICGVDDSDDRAWKAAETPASAPTW